MIYHLFAWDNYYPSPSLDDYQGHFATADEAVAAGHELNSCDAFSVVYQDETGRLVEHTRHRRAGRYA